MVALLREFPQVKLTFNLVPSLLVQLEAFAEDARARPAPRAGPEAGRRAHRERRARRCSRNSSTRSGGRMIDLYPRYAELLQKRGRAAGDTPTQDFLDLQVWHKLAWVDPFYLDADARVRRLVAEAARLHRGRQARAARGRARDSSTRHSRSTATAAERGQVELSTSPFYHPILPLLCDTDIYQRTHPARGMPRQRVPASGGCAEQLARARRCHERLFGQRPAGLWPSEGSVSDAWCRSGCRRPGFQWMATDEVILAGRIGREFRRDAQGRLEQPEPLYRAVRRAGRRHAGSACLFRDHALSDLIGFAYAGWDAEAAAADFVEPARRSRPAILRGERRGRGHHLRHPRRRERLGALRRRRPAVPARAVRQAVRPSGAADGDDERGRQRVAARRLTGIFPGSWIDANFYIWIGHADDHRAWSQLARRAPGVRTRRAGRAPSPSKRESRRARSC